MMLYSSLAYKSTIGLNSTLRFVHFWSTSIIMIHACIGTCTKALSIAI